MKKTHLVFEGLSDIMETKRFDQQEDGKCVGALYKQFVRYRMCKRFEMALLHTHFPVFEDEMIVSRFDPEKRLLVGGVQVAEKAPGILPMSWRLFEQGGQKALMANQYLATTADVGKCNLQLDEYDREFLAGVSSILSTHNALNRFGVQLHLPVLIPNPGEYLMEYTDDENRTFILAFITEEEFKAAPRRTETSWIFSPEDGSLEPAQLCRFQRHCPCPP